MKTKNTGLLISLLFPLAVLAQGPEQRMEQVENGLEPALQITGEPKELFNLEERMAVLNVSGLSIAVMKDGQIDWAKGYGFADKEKDISASENTLFQAASIHKSVLATRILQLAESGNIDLDTDINQYLNTWQVPENEFTLQEKVTLRRILNHTAGLTIWGLPNYPQDESMPSIVEILDGDGTNGVNGINHSYGGVRVFQKPGSGWLYSGGGYLLAQLLIEELDSTSFAENMQKHILDPLGMINSTFTIDPPENWLSRAATAYMRSGEPVKGNWLKNPATLWTTPTDLVRFASAIQQVYQSGNDGILKRETVEQMLTVGLRGHGLGVETNDHNFYKGGSNEGYRSIFYAWKEKPVSVAIMLNTDDGTIMREILFAVAKAYDLPGLKPEIKTIIPLDTQAMERLTGEFQADDRGPVFLELKDGQLRFTSSLFSPILVYPQSETVLFDRSGNTYDFEFIDGVNQGFRLPDGRFVGNNNISGNRLK